MADQQDQQPSELLRALGLLDEAAWAETLLPLLRANKSAGAFALACKQLRQLCHGNQRELQLTGANCQHMGHLELDAFGQHFPACSSVTFTASSAVDVVLHFTCVLPLLARLPKLHSLQLNINTSRANTPDHVAQALQLMRLQLPQLRSLQLVLYGSWTSQRCWQMLGATTQLTKLAIDFKNSIFSILFDDDSSDDDDDDDPGISLGHLSALRPLGRGLQHLALTAECFEPHTRQGYSFLGSFSGLTSLALPLINKRSGLAAISSCTALQHLRLKRRGSATLDAAECAALAQLTRLTELVIPPSSDTPALLAALRRLRGLQKLGLHDINSSHLPVLAALTKLTSLGGIWVDTPADQAAAAAGGATCPLIARLWMTGPFPLAAFPGAKEVVMNDAWQPSRLASLSQHMKALESFGISGGIIKKSTFRSLDPSALEAERVAAVRSLGQLAQLTQLQFSLNDDAEVAALGTVTQLKRLVLAWLPRGSSLSATGLSSLFPRLSLEAVTLQLHWRLPQSEAMSLLCSLSSVRCIKVCVANQQQKDVWKAAAAAARAARLPLPARWSIGALRQPTGRVGPVLE